MSAPRARALADRRYRWLYAAQCTSLLATGLVTMALGLLSFEVAGSDAGAVLGGALALKMIAYVTAPPLIGALVAAIPRARLMTVLDLARGALVLALPFVGAIWQIYLLVFLTQLMAAAFTPTFQATIPDLFEDEETYAGTLSLSRLAYDVEQLATPILAALILSFASFDMLFYLAAASFFLSALCVRWARPPELSEGARAEAAATPFEERASHGVRLYLGTPTLRAYLALYGAIASASAFVIVLSVMRAMPNGGDDALLAAYFAAAGAGAIVAALIWPAKLQRFGARKSALLSGGAIVVAFLCWALIAGEERALAIDLPFWFALGLGAAAAQLPGGVLIRRTAEGADRAALFAAHFALTHAFWFVTYLAAGQASRVLALPTIAGAFALVSIAAFIVAARAWPREKGVR